MRALSAHMIDLDFLFLDSLSLLTHIHTYGTVHHTTPQLNFCSVLAWIRAGSIRPLNLLARSLAQSRTHFMDTIFILCSMALLLLLLCCCWACWYKFVVCCFYAVVVGRSVVYCFVVVSLLSSSLPSFFLVPFRFISVGGPYSSNKKKQICCVLCVYNFAFDALHLWIKLWNSHTSTEIEGDKKKWPDTVSTIT